jgi:hypothetical protein
VVRERGASLLERTDLANQPAKHAVLLVSFVSRQRVVAAALAEQYDFTDVDSRRPRPLTLEEV